MILVLLVLGGLVALVGYVWILIAAFTESIPWGVGMLFISPLALVFGVLKWDELKVPTILFAAGGAVYILGRVLS
ncbi:MAG TPA: hypothetical protein VKE74_08270 [Gemmataceae bacterium]|nr:hypothetical protein [Gemmataceae bacterium]